MQRMAEAVARTAGELSAPPLSRREFLYYLWGASMAVFMAGTGGAVIWFALPRFREGEYGGIVNVPVGDVPPPDSPPVAYPDGRFWLVNIGPKTLADPRQPANYPLQQGIKAIYMVCVHLGCLYKWVPEALDAGGNVVARSEPSLGTLEGTAVPLTPEIVTLRIDTGRRITGAPNTRPGGGR
jgi:cytochrome b6-f complex iron-sulfur subunit